jgi:Secretion system C-terminal sorting domain
MKQSTFPHLALLGLGVLGAGPLAAQTPVLTSNGGTLFVNTGGTLQVNGGYAQTGAALLRTAGTATVAGNLSAAAASGLDLAAGTLDVTGDVSSAATLSGTTGTLQLSGPGAQALGVSGGTVPNLRISKASGTAALTQPVAVRQVLSLTSAGNLSTNGQPLTLLSDASGTALVANLGAGLVTGNVTVQRYIDGSLNPGLGYRHLAAPVFTATVASFGSGGTTPVVNSAYNAAANPGQVAPFPTVYFYDQARLATSPATTLSAFDKGWQSPDALTDAAPLGLRGFTVQLPGASTLSFTGPVIPQGDTAPLSRAGGATAADAGWNLVGNPFPSPLDLSTVAAGQRTNMDAAFYTYESTSQYGGGYRSFVNGFGNPLIGSSQAFFVRVSQGQTGGSLELTNANRVTTYDQQAPVRRGTADSRPQLQLTLAGNGLSDALTIYAQPGATTGFDREFDAAKLWNPSGLSVATVAASGEALAIDGRPAFPLGQPVPLTVQTPRAGSYSLTATDLLNLPAGTDVVLVDLSASTRTPLLSGTRYSLTLPAGTTAGRLQLEVTGRALSTSSQLAQQLSVYPNPTQGQVQLVRPAAWGGLQVQVLNSIGQAVQTTRLSAGEQTLSVQELPVGVYTLRLTTQQGQTLTKRLVRQ